MNTAGRRRRQAIGGYKDIPPSQRPRYRAVTAEKAQARLNRLVTKTKLRNDAVAKARAKKGS